MGSELKCVVPLSSVMGRFGGQRPPYQSMTSKFGSLLSPLVDLIGGGGLYHVLVLWLLVLRGTCVL